MLELNLTLLAKKRVKPSTIIIVMIKSFWEALKYTNNLEPINPLKNQPPMIEGKISTLILTPIMMSKSLSPL